MNHIITDTGDNSCQVVSKQYTQSTLGALTTQNNISSLTH